jgi:cell division initiation protein
MKIGPVDIRNHTFSRQKMRGVDEGEVRAYLDLVADRLEEAILESDDLRTRIDRIERELGEYRQMDKSLRDALLSAERLSDGRLDQADREARIVLKNAEVEGEKIIGTARLEAGRIRGTLDDLRRQRITYVERFRALLRSQMKILEASIESFDPELDEVERTLDGIDDVILPEHRRGSAAPAPSSQPTQPTPAPGSAPGSSSGAAIPGWRPPDRAEPRSDAPAPPPSGPASSPESSDPSRYLGEEGLFSAARADDESRPEGS